MKNFSFILKILLGNAAQKGTNCSLNRSFDLCQRELETRWVTRVPTSIGMCSMQLGIRYPLPYLRSPADSVIFIPVTQYTNKLGCWAQYRSQKNISFDEAYQNKKERRMTKGIFTPRRCSENNRISVLWDISFFHLQTFSNVWGSIIGGRTFLNPTYFVPSELKSAFVIVWGSQRVGIPVMIGL